MLKGFSFTQNGKEICEFFPLSSDLIRKSESEHDIFTVGMAYSNMELINSCLIAAYDIGGIAEYERILKVYSQYVDTMARTELEFMNILPEIKSDKTSAVSISNYADLTTFLSNPDWSLILISIKNSIKKIDAKIIDEHPLKNGLLLRDLHKISNTIMIPGLHWYEKPIATLPLIANFLENYDLPNELTMKDFHNIVFDKLITKVKEFAKSESDFLLFNDLAHDKVMSLLRCVKLAVKEPIAFYFSAIRYSTTAPLIRDLSLINSCIYCPFFLFCNDMILRTQIRGSYNESCILRENLMNSLKLVEEKIPSNSCCSESSFFQNIAEVSGLIPQHIENLLSTIVKIISQENNCILCNSLKNTLTEQGYSKEMITDLAKYTKPHLQNYLNDVLIPPPEYIKKS